MALPAIRLPHLEFHDPVEPKSRCLSGFAALLLQAGFRRFNVGSPVPNDAKRRSGYGLESSTMQTASIRAFSAL